MLRIKNIEKLVDRVVMGGWVIKTIDYQPITSRYIFDIHCFGPIGNKIDGCTISIGRRGEMNVDWVLVYFFYYNGHRTGVSASSDWMGDIDNFVGQLEYIIQVYHNKK